MIFGAKDDDGLAPVKDNKPKIDGFVRLSGVFVLIAGQPRLSDDLRCAVGKPVTLFRASEAGAQPHPYKGNMNYITDGPFLYRSATGELFMIWSSFLEDKYSVFLVKFENGTLGTQFRHLPPLYTKDGGHGMIFQAENKLLLTFHSPNALNKEHPCFFELTDHGDRLTVKE